MDVKPKAPYVLSALVVALMVVQSVLGLVYAGEYRDIEWIKLTWLGNDWITLVVAAPLMAAGLLRVRQGSTRGLLVWLGMLGYSIYSYAFYLFGAVLNAFFPFYVAALILSIAALILVLAHIDVPEVAARFSPRTPVRIIGGYLTFVAITFFILWPALWAAYIFAGRLPPGGSEPFRVVAGLDLTMMMPALGTGGILLWRRRAWGYLIAGIAAIQGALYLLLLTVNSLVSIARGLTEAPGELPMWGTLFVATSIVAVLLLMSARAREGRTAGPTPRVMHGAAA